MQVLSLLLRPSLILFFHTCSCTWALLTLLHWRTTEDQASIKSVTRKGPVWMGLLQEGGQARSWGDPGGGHALTSGTPSLRILASRQSWGWVTGSRDSPNTVGWAQDSSQVPKETELPSGTEGSIQEKMPETDLGLQHTYRVRLLRLLLLVAK